MAKEQLNNRTPEELRQILQEQRAKRAQLREELVGKRLKNTAEIQQVRRQIARTLTTLHSMK